jgi:hypothetical protein
MKVTIAYILTDHAQRQYRLAGVHFGDVLS